MNGITFFCISR